MKEALLLAEAAEASHSALLPSTSASPLPGDKLLQSYDKLLMAVADASRAVREETARVVAAGVGGGGVKGAAGGKAEEEELRALQARVDDCGARGRRFGSSFLCQVSFFFRP